MKNEDKKSGIYFDLESYVAKIMQECGMQNSSEETKKALTEEIGITLTDRVNATVVNSLTADDLFLMEKTMEDHPELDRLDVLSIITSYIDGLDEKIVTAVDELYGEIVDNFKKIKSLSPNK